MRISFYTIDDFRLGHDPKGVTGWRLSQFLNWRDALEHYHSLPNDRVKEFGLPMGCRSCSWCGACRSFLLTGQGMTSS